MSTPQGSGPKKRQEDQDLLQKARQGTTIAKTTFSVGRELQGKNPHMALNRLLLGGMKLAEEVAPASSPELSGIFYHEQASPLELAAELHKLGIRAIAWEPETLMAEIDRKYRNWTPERVSEALERFQRTGVIDSEVPPLVRNKLYAIRLVATTDTAHAEWNVFEKVGGAFNGRIPLFGLVEPLSALECATTVALIENIRPDTYDNEVKIYIAACCHTQGFSTVSPVKWIAMAEPFLQQMIYEETGEKPHPTTLQQITEKFQELMERRSSVAVIEDDVVSVQAHKLAAIAIHAEDAMK